MPDQPIHEVARDGHTYEVHGDGRWAGRRWSLVWCPPPFVPPIGETRPAAVCVTGTGEAVVVSMEDDLTRWIFPGGHVQPGESLDQALLRETMEEACAAIERSIYLGAYRISDLDGTDGYSSNYQALYWARVTLLPFRQDFETAARRVVPVADLRRHLYVSSGADPIIARILRDALEVEHAQAGR